MRRAGASLLGLGAILLSACRGEMLPARVVEKTFTPSQVGWAFGGQNGGHVVALGESYALLVQEEWSQKVETVSVGAVEYQMYKVGDKVYLYCYWYGCSI